MLLTECLSLTSGYLAALLSNVMATMGSACAQALQEAVPTFQLNLSRYTFQMTLCFIVVLVKRMEVRLHVTEVPYLLLAGLFSNLFNISYYTASALLPLGTLLVVTNVTQIINSTIINRLVFHKNVSPLKFTFIAVMIVALVLILQPRFMFHGAALGQFSTPATPAPLLLTTDLMEESNATTPAQPVIDGLWTASAHVLGVGLAVMAGLSSTWRGAIYKKSLSHVHAAVIGFWIGILGFVPSFVAMFYFDAINISLSGVQVLLLFGHGFGAASYSSLTIYAQQKLTPVTWAMMDNSKLILNFVLQYTLLKDLQPGHRNAVEVVGAVVAVLAIIGSVVFDIRADQAMQELTEQDARGPTKKKLSSD